METKESVVVAIEVSSERIERRATAWRVWKKGVETCETVDRDQYNHTTRNSDLACDSTIHLGKLPDERYANTDFDCCGRAKPGRLEQERIVNEAIRHLSNQNGRGTYKNNRELPRNRLELESYRTRNSALVAIK